MTTHAHDNDAQASTTHDNNDVVVSCMCEHVVHEDASHNNVHAYGASMSGRVACRYIGDVCTACATTHMSEYVVGTTHTTTTPAQTIEPAPIVWVCTDCMLADVNGDTSGVTPERAAELWSRHDGIAWYVGDEDTDLDFGTMPCAACDTLLAGMRHAYAFTR